MLKRCVHGEPSSPTADIAKRLEGGVLSFEFLKPKMCKNRCRIWIKRPHLQLNPSKINKRRFSEGSLMPWLIRELDEKICIFFSVFFCMIKPTSVN